MDFSDAIQQFSLGAADLSLIRRSGSKIAVLDLIRLITGLSSSNAQNLFKRLLEHHPDLGARSTHMIFGKGRPTPGTDLHGAIEIIMLLPGKIAAHFRRAAASIVVRYLGGDVSLIDEVMHNYHLQEQLPPNHPLRIFGDAVEAAMASDEVRTSRIRVLTEGFAALQLTGSVTPLDELRYKNAVENVMYSASSSPSDPELDVSQFLREKGRWSKATAIKFGRKVAELFRKECPGQSFVKRDRLVDGQVVKVNVWRESQRPLLERALRCIAD